MTLAPESVGSAIQSDSPGRHRKVAAWLTKVHESGVAISQ